MTTIDGLPYRFDLFDSGAIVELDFRVESGYSLPVVVALLEGRYSQSVCDIERVRQVQDTFCTDVSDTSGMRTPHYVRQSSLL